MLLVFISFLLGKKLWLQAVAIAPLCALDVEQSIATLSLPYCCGMGKNYSEIILILTLLKALMCPHGLCEKTAAGHIKIYWYKGYRNRYFF